jgi:hypothetical protein
MLISSLSLRQLNSHCADIIATTPYLRRFLFFTAIRAEIGIQHFHTELPGQPALRRLHYAIEPVVFSDNSRFLLAGFRATEAARPAGRHFTFSQPGYMMNLLNRPLFSQTELLRHCMMHESLRQREETVVRSSISLPPPLHIGHAAICTGFRRRFQASASRDDRDAIGIFSFFYFRMAG